eukprot:gene21030-27899_t
MSDQASEQAPEQEQEQEQKTKQEVINIVVKDQSGTEVTFKVKPSTKFGKIMDAYCTKKALDPNTVKFLFDGTKIQRDKTPLELEIEDGDNVDANIYCMTSGLSHENTSDAGFFNSTTYSASRTAFSLLTPNIFDFCCNPLLEPATDYQTADYTPYLSPARFSCLVAPRQYQNLMGHLSH